MPATSLDQIRIANSRLGANDIECIQIRMSSSMNIRKAPYQQEKIYNAVLSRSLHHRTGNSFRFPGFVSARLIGLPAKQIMNR